MTAIYKQKKSIAATSYPALKISLSTAGEENVLI